MHGVNDQNQYSAGNCAKVWAKEWDNLGHANDHTDQGCVGCPQQRRADKTQNSYYKGIYDLTAQETYEGLMSKTEGSNSKVRRVPLKQSKRYLF